MRRRNLWIGVMALVGLMQGCACATAQQQAQSPTAQQAQNPAAPPAAGQVAAGQAAGIDAIGVYAGVWKIHTEQFDTAHSKAGKRDNILHNECWKNGPYFACNQYVDGISKVLLIFTYVAQEGRYATYQVPLDGGAPGSGKLFVAGNVWIFPWESTEDGKAVYFRVVNTFTAPDHIEYRQEFSTDNVNWTAMAKGQESRTSNE